MKLTISVTDEHIEKSTASKTQPNGGHNPVFYAMLSAGCSAPLVAINSMCFYYDGIPRFLKTPIEVVEFLEKYAMGWGLFPFSFDIEVAPTLQTPESIGEAIECLDRDIRKFNAN